MSKSRDIADSAATINYIDGLTSDAQSQINTVQSEIDNFDPLPSQTGNADKYLTTDGTTASWAEVAGGITYTVKTADYTAASGDFVLVDTTSGIITITLPASPAAGDTVTVTDSNSNNTQNAIIVARNGNNIMGLSEDLYISQSGSTASLVYSGTEWRLF